MCCKLGAPSQNHNEVTLPLTSSNILDQCQTHLLSQVWVMANLFSSLVTNKDCNSRVLSHKHPWAPCIICSMEFFKGQTSYMNHINNTSLHQTLQSWIQNSLCNGIWLQFWNRVEEKVGVTCMERSGASLTPILFPPSNTLVLILCVPAFLIIWYQPVVLHSVSDCAQHHLWNASPFRFSGVPLVAITCRELYKSLLERSRHLLTWTETCHVQDVDLVKHCKPSPVTIEGKLIELHSDIRSP